MSFSLFDILGLIGAGFILATYAGLQAGKVDPKSVTYSALNALGAGLILLSLYFDFNMAAAVIESAWLLISLFGLFKAWGLRH